MSILIIGDYSYLGKSIRSYLQKYGFKIINVDFVQNDNNDENFYLFSNISCFKLFLEDRKINLIINLYYLCHEFSIDTTKDIKLILQKFEISYLLLNKINEFFNDLKYKSGFKYFVFFPNSIFGLQENDNFCSEYSLVNPHSHHAALLSGIYSNHHVYKNQYLLPITKIIVGNLYGKNYYYDYNIILKIINNSIKKKNILIQGNGKKMRNWLHIEDLCHMLYLVVSTNIERDVFCLSGENLYFIDFVKLICKKCDDYCMNNNLEYEASSLIKFTATSERYCLSYQMKSSQIFDIFKYTNQFTIENSLDHLIEYYFKQLLS